jgi:hypothetical protein
MSFSGTIHASDCRSGKHVYKVVAPDLPEADVAEFIQVRRMVACGVCLRKFVAVAE